MLIKIHILGIWLSYAAFSAASLAAVLYIMQDHNIKHKNLGFFFSRLPSLSFLDQANYRSIGIGFPLLTLSIILGSLLSRNTTGSYWTWNLREIYSVILWILYVVILHVRLSSRMRGRKVAYLSISAFAVIILSLFTNCGRG